MNQPGKNIVYLLFGLFTAAAFISSCTDGNEPENFNHPKDKISLSISFHSAQQTRAENGLRSNEIGEDVIERESAIYSLAVLVFKENGELDGKKFIGREITDIPGSGYKDYRELDEIKDIELTAGIRDVYIIANTPDEYLTENGPLDQVNNINSFRQVVEQLSAQGMYDHPEDNRPKPGNTPIGGEEPDDRYTNLVMTKSFIGLPINSGAEKHYLGYTGNDGRPEGETTGTPLDGTNPVELVRLVARVAIQKIAFDLPETLTFDAGKPTSIYNQYVDTVFLINAKTASSYFPGDNAFPKPAGSFGHGNTTGYDYLANQWTGNIAGGAVFVDYLHKPINFEEYDITKNQVPLWFYAFENGDSGSSPTAFVIGVKYQYRNPGDNEDSEPNRKKVYYVVVVNRPRDGKTANHDYIERNNQYGIQVTIKGLGSYMTDYPPTKSVSLRTVDLLSAQDAEGVLEIEETVGPNLFPWTGDVYKQSGDDE